MDQLLELAPRFEFDAAEAKTVLAQVVAAVERWRDIAQSPAVAMASTELESFAPAFEHSQLERARELARWVRG